METPKLHHRCRNILLLAPVLSQMNAAHVISFRSILVLSSYLHMYLPNGLFHLDFQSNISAFLGHPALLDLHPVLQYNLCFLAWFTS
jgi:hypothetical protein